MKSIKNNKMLSISVIINTLVFIITGIIFSYLYETNDDYFMSTISEGSGENEYLIFINVIYGKIIKMLNLIIPNLNWYGIMMYFIAFISMITLTYIILKNVNKKVGIYVGAIFSMIYAIDIFYQIQFTKVSVVAMLAGILLIKETLKNRNIKIIFLGSVLFIIGSMIRFSGIYVVIVFIGLLVLGDLIYLIKEKEIVKKNVKAFLIFPLICIMLGICAVGFKIVNDSIYKSDDDMKNYLLYNKARARVHDYNIADYDKFKEEYDKLGISKLDIECFKTWLNGDVEKFDYETLISIREIEPAEDSVNDAIKNSILKILDNATKSTSVAIILSIIIIGYILLFKKNKYIYIFMSIFGVCVLYTVLSYKGRLVYRVEYGIWISAFMVSIYSLNDYIKYNLKNGILIISTLAIGIALNFNTYDKFERISKNHRDSSVNEILDLAENNQENIYFYATHAMSESFEGISPFTNCNFDKIENLIPLGGWLINSKKTKKIWGEYDIKNPFKDLIEKDNAYLIDAHQFEAICQYIEENYYEDIGYSLEGSFGKYNLYKLYEK